MNARLTARLIVRQTTPMILAAAAARWSQLANTASEWRLDSGGGGLSFMETSLKCGKHQPPVDPGRPGAVQSGAVPLRMAVAIYVGFPPRKSTPNSHHFSGR